MTRLVTSGFEIYAASGAQLSQPGAPDGYLNIGTCSRDTTTKRSGGASLRANPSGTSAIYQYAFTGTLDRGYYHRIYLRITTLPSATIDILGWQGSSGDGSWTRVTLNIDGTVSVAATPTKSAPLNDGQWHRIELFTKASATQANRAWELRVDGVTISNGTGQTLDAVISTASLGIINASGTQTFNLNLDDWAVNDDQGVAPHNTWPGDGYVILLTPNADNNRGSWGGGAGGTTNLWDAINNTPPIGAAAPGTNTSQISANGVATTGKFDTTSYIAAGATAGHTAVLCHIVACHGEQIATGTKSGSASTDIAVNNVPSSSATFNYGNDAGAEGAWPSLWLWATGAAAPYTAQPTLTTGARLNIVTTTSSRVADCCFLGLYVEMQPPAAPRKSMVANPARRQQVARLSRWY